MKNCLLLDLGQSFAFSTIVIPALTGANSALSPEEIIIASWLGKILKRLLSIVRESKCFSSSLLNVLCRQHYVHFLAIGKCLVRMDYGTDWTQKSYVFCKCAAFDRLEYAYALFLYINNGSSNCNGFSWTRRRFDGDTNFYLCWRSLVG